MAQKLKTLIEDMEFTEETRAQLVFSDPTKIRLDPKTGFVELKKDSDGKFPTTADIHVISPLFQPKAVRDWVGFQAFIKNVFIGLTKITGEGFRLHDGTDQFFWNGSAWVVNTTSWNTENDVAANIAAFPVTTRKIRVVINLTTTKATATPQLNLVKLAWKAKLISALEDIIYRSLVPFLRTADFITDLVQKVPFPGGLTLNVGKAIDASGIPFNTGDLDSIFDHNADPEHLTDLLASYDQSTRVATLSSAIPVGNQAFIQLTVKPEVAVEHTHQDFIEVEKAPALLVTDISSVDSSPLSTDDHVVNKADGTAIRVKAPYRFNVSFTMIALAPGAIDLMRMIQAVVDLVENQPLLLSPALDRSYRLWLIDEFNTQTRPNRADLHTSQATFMIKDVLSWGKPAVSEVAVQRLKFEGDGNVKTTIPFTI